MESAEFLKNSDDIHRGHITSRNQQIITNNNKKKRCLAKSRWTSVFIKFYWNTYLSIHVCISYGCFLTTIVELKHNFRGWAAHKAKSSTIWSFEQEVNSWCNPFCAKGGLKKAPIGFTQQPVRNGHSENYSWVDILGCGLSDMDARETLDWNVCVVTSHTVSHTAQIWSVFPLLPFSQSVSEFRAVISPSQEILQYQVELQKTWTPGVSLWQLWPNEYELESQKVCTFHTNTSKRFKLQGH